MEKSGQHISETCREAAAAQQLQQAVPPHRVEGFSDVQLKQERRLLETVHPSSHVAHIHKIIMDASRFDESGLGAGNQRMHERGKSGCHHLCHDRS